MNADMNNKLKLDILQEFIPSQGVFNDIIKCNWTPSVILMERKVNPNKMDSSKYPLYQRLITYEGPSHLVNTEPVVSTLVISDINVACKFIADQLQNHGFKLTHANFFFKIDQEGELVLLYTSQIKTTPHFK